MTQVSTAEGFDRSIRRFPEFTRINATHHRTFGPERVTACSRSIATIRSANAWPKGNWRGLPRGSTTPRSFSSLRSGPVVGFRMAAPTVGIVRPQKHRQRQKHAAVGGHCRAQGSGRRRDSRVLSLQIVRDSKHRGRQSHRADMPFSGQARFTAIHVLRSREIGGISPRVSAPMSVEALCVFHGIDFRKARHGNQNRSRNGNGTRPEFAAFRRATGRIRRAGDSDRRRSGHFNAVAFLVKWNSDAMSFWPRTIRRGPRNSRSAGVYRRAGESHTSWPDLVSSRP
jgi:hypothetical protein